MGTRLVTVATFDQVVQAQMAADAIRAAGIDVAVADAELVSMDWLLSAAVGGIKVQVREEDADRAVAELNRTFGEYGEGLGEGPGGDAGPGSPADEDEAPGLADDAPDPEPDPVQSSRDEYARRLVIAAAFGLAFAPLWFFAVYLFLNAAFGEGSLSERGRNKLFVGTFLTAIGFPMAFLVLWMFGI